MEEKTLHVYLADFGLTKIIADSGTACTRTMSGKCGGTPGFQAKEVLQGRGDITSACDVYSFGCVLIELYGKRRVWPGLTQLVIMCRIAVENEAPQVDDIQPESIKQLCKQCVVNNAKQRPKASITLQYLLQCVPPEVINNLIAHAYAHSACSN